MGFQGENLKEDPLQAGLSETGLTSIPNPTPAIIEEPTLDAGTGEGILGGHFDLDTSSKIYDFSKGKTDHHVHEYDDKYDVRGVDFFSMHESSLKEINELVHNGKRFALILANSQLSTGAKLEINGETLLAVNYQGQPSKVYTIGAPNIAGDVELKSLKIYFDKNVISNGGLIPTQTGCVVKNDSGKLGE